MFGTEAYIPAESTNATTTITVVIDTTRFHSAESVTKTFYSTVTCGFISNYNMGYNRSTDGYGTKTTLERWTESYTAGISYYCLSAYNTYAYSSAASMYGKPDIFYVRSTYTSLCTSSKAGGANSYTRTSGEDTICNSTFTAAIGRKEVLSWATVDHMSTWWYYTETMYLGAVTTQTSNQLLYSGKGTTTSTIEINSWT